MAMMWVNFIILAAIIFKYARDPIKTFLKQQKKDVVSEMKKLEAEKDRVIGEISAAEVQSAKNKRRFEEMKARLVAQGETRKKQIVDQARQQGSLMIEETQKKMETRILHAKDRLKLELADMAFDRAIEKTAPNYNGRRQPAVAGKVYAGHACRAGCDVIARGRGIAVPS